MFKCFTPCQKSFLRRRGRKETAASAQDLCAQCCRKRKEEEGEEENNNQDASSSPEDKLVASRKSSGKLNNVGKDLRESTEHEELSTAGFPTSNDGETIRIFRRSRSGRPHSATRQDSLAVTSPPPVAPPSGQNPNCISNFPAVSPSSRANSLTMTSTDLSGDGTSAGSDPTALQGQGHEVAVEDEVLKTEELPAPDTPAGTREAFLKLKQLLSKLRDNSIDTETLISNLEYVTEVVQAVAAKTEDETEDDLSELQSEAVPDEVRKWLASTFAKQEQVTRRSEERPSFKSVANAIRTGIFIERIYRRMSSSQLMIIPPEVQRALKQSNDWTFDTFSLAVSCKGSPLRFMGYELLTRHGCLHKFKIPPSVLETMLVHVEQGYASNGNHYHNHLHACDVLQTIHYFISETVAVQSWLSDLEIFTCLMAAIIHDFDHSGTTNNFHINSASGLALLYNDRAVLENHHVSAFFRLIQEHDCNIFTNMQKSDFREFRNLIIEMVLHTDMSQHFSQLKAMKTLLQQHNGEPSFAFKQWRKLKHGRLIATPNLKPREISFDQTKVLCLLLHTCDVSHPAKRWDVHWQWTARCIEEFFEQGDREAELGLEYSPLCDRHNTMVPQSQIGFIDFIVSPTMNVLGDVLETILRNLEIANKKPSKRGENGEIIPDLREEKTALLKRPWSEILTVNKAKWQEKHDAGEQGIEPSGAMADLRPQSVTSITGKSRPSSARLTDHYEVNEKTSPVKSPTDSPAKEAPLRVEELDGLQEPYQRRGRIAITDEKIVIDSNPPIVDTRLEDIADELPPHVLSRSGTPGTWDFDERESGFKAAPPRPGSASLCSPPTPRRVPISVDHYLRK